MIIIRCFFPWYNILFYTQAAFVFHILVDFCMFHDLIVAFFSLSSLERIFQGNILMFFGLGAGKPASWHLHLLLV